MAPIYIIPHPPYSPCMTDCVFEFYSEEIPALMQRPMAQWMQSTTENWLKEHGLKGDVTAHATPMRLAVIIENLPQEIAATSHEIRGPRVDAPKQALDGFIKGNNVTQKQLEKRTTPKGEFYFAVTQQEAQNLADILPDLANLLLEKAPWPKSMRWGNNAVRWVRPLKSICAVFGGAVLPVTFGDIKAGDTSKGHRFLAPKPFKVKNATQYQQELAKRYVTLCSHARQDAITSQAAAIAKKSKLSVIEDTKLLEEIAGLVEHPIVLKGSFDAAFMELPEEVLISSIRAHQKYLCTRDAKGKLANVFLVASNMECKDKGKAIIAGNEKVLTARLSDGAFFYEQDQKTPLLEHGKLLSGMVFHAKLGSMADKITRITALAKFLAVWVPHANLQEVERAAQLCKADLTTDMVDEFPDLQGIMGHYYAQKQNEPDSVVTAIKDHYKPQGQQDAVPQDPVAITVAIADKIDSLAGLFAVGEVPTGSKDPFALRRAALGVIRIIIEHKLHIPLKLLFTHALKQYPKTMFKPDAKDDSTKTKKLLVKVLSKGAKPNDVVEQLFGFFADRTVHLLKSENIRHDLIMAVMQQGKEDDLLNIIARVQSLQSFLATENGGALLAGYKRANNILKKEDALPKGMLNKTLLAQPEEHSLYEVANDAKSNLKKLLKKQDNEAAMQLLSELKTPIDNFFDKVVVNDDNATIRSNRLRLLNLTRNMMEEVADFSVIEG